jgi:hypothetical protein
LFLDRVGFQVLFCEQRKRECGLFFLRNSLFHGSILSQFPVYEQNYLAMEHSEGISGLCGGSTVRSRHAVSKKAARPNGAVNSVWIYAHIDLLGIRSGIVRLRFGIHQ